MVQQDLSLFPFARSAEREYTAQILNLNSTFACVVCFCFATTPLRSSAHYAHAPFRWAPPPNPLAPACWPEDRLLRKESFRAV